MSQGVVILEGDNIGFESLAPTSATGITESVYKPASGAPRAQSVLITVETYQVRFRCDGTDPTASVGHIIPAGGSYLLRGYTNIANLSFIDTAVGASTVRVSTFA